MAADLDKSSPCAIVELRTDKFQEWIKGEAMMQNMLKFCWKRSKKGRQ